MSQRRKCADQKQNGHQPAFSVAISTGRDRDSNDCSRSDSSQHHAQHESKRKDWFHACNAPEYTHHARSLVQDWTSPEIGHSCPSRFCTHGSNQTLDRACLLSIAPPDADNPCSSPPPVPVQNAADRRRRGVTDRGLERRFAALITGGCEIHSMVA